MRGKRHLLNEEKPRVACFVANCLINLKFNNGTCYPFHFSEMYFFRRLSSMQEVSRFVH